MMNKIKKFYSAHRVLTVFGSVVAITIVVGCIIFATLDTPTPKTVDVTVKLVSEDAKENPTIIVNGIVEIVDTDGTIANSIAVVLDTPVKLNAPLVVGEYKVLMGSVPIASDGSIYELSDKEKTVVISDNDGENINIEIPVERVVIDDMTKEQLSLTAKRLSENAPDGNKELIGTLTKRQEANESDDVSDDESQSESDSEDTPKPDDAKPENKPSTGNSNSNGNGSSNSGNTSSGHEHNWVANMITVRGTPAIWTDIHTPGRTYVQTSDVFVDGCTFIIGTGDNDHYGIIARHAAQHGDMAHTQTSETITEESTFERKIEVEAVPAHQEQRGYVCSCGATK